MKKLLLIVILFIGTLSAVAQPTYIAPEKTGAELISFLEANYSVTNSLGYSPARDVMYNVLDKKDGQISCVYTGYTITFTDRQDAQGTQAGSDFNTEHTWPQSFFDSESTMRSDIHHLFPTRVDVNGARNNFKFDEIPDEQTSTWYGGGINQSGIPSTNIDTFSELLSNTSFEPREDHKGNVARAIFYFWTIYQNHPNIVNDGTDNTAFFNEMKEVMLAWHDADPVDQREIERSLGIESAQGNRNPYIHDTTLVRRAYFDGVAISNEYGEDFPVVSALNQNYPNPFNPTTQISYSLSESGNVQLVIYDLLGQMVATLVNERQAVGEYTISFDAQNLPSGVYIYQLNSPSASFSRKMTLIK